MSIHALKLVNGIERTPVGTPEIQTVNAVSPRAYVPGVPAVPATATTPAIPAIPAIPAVAAVTAVAYVPASPPDPALVKAWEDKEESAAALIYLRLEEDQKIHVNGIETNPVAMWRKLMTIHQQKKPAQRFNAYEALFSIAKKPDESLARFASRVDEALQAIRVLRDNRYSLADQDNELGSMMLIRGLPVEEYGHFRSALLLSTSLDMEDITEALIAEDANQSSSANAVALKAATAAANSSSSFSKPQDYAQKTCTFCQANGHVIDTCYAFERMKKTASQEQQEKSKQRKERKKGKGRANAAKETEDKAPEQAAQSIELAGNASAFDFSSPTSPIISDAGTDWNTDTAT